jgi:hypothetical protein
VTVNEEVCSGGTSGATSQPECKTVYEQQCSTKMETEMETTYKDECSSVPEQVPLYVKIRVTTSAPLRWRQPTRMNASLYQSRYRYP